MDEARQELVRDWLTKASHDLQTVRIIANVPDGPLDTAIYHCQQAAEKSIKAWLQANDNPFPKTHDIEELVKMAAVINSEFGKFAQAAYVLTPYVSAFRYPGGFDEPMPSRAEFDAALQHAQTIYDFVLNLLPKEAQP
jgi:HEPN domain-containing protein